MAFSSKTTLLRLVRLLAIYLLGFVSLIATDPQRLPSVVLILPFVIFFVAIYMTVVEFLRLTRENASQEKSNGGLTMRPRRIAFLVASVPTLLLILQSIGQLGVIDAALALTILVVGYFYVLRSASSENN